MFFHKQSMALFAACVLGVSAASYAEGVFENRSMEGHALTAVENAQLDTEFARKYGKTGSDAVVKGNNPWEAKKKQVQEQKKTTWGECRDYALQQRSQCYKEGRDAYACERFYEARSMRCDKNF